MIWLGNVVDSDQCLYLCRQESKATGCELRVNTSEKTGLSSCFVHTGLVAESGYRQLLPLQFINRTEGLPICSGHCESDQQCAAGLMCFEQRTTPPGCNGTLMPNSRYCYDPTFKSMSNTESKCWIFSKCRHSIGRLQNTTAFLQIGIGTCNGRERQIQIVATAGKCQYICGLESWCTFISFSRSASLCKMYDFANIEECVMSGLIEVASITYAVRSRLMVHAPELSLKSSATCLESLSLSASSDLVDTTQVNMLSSWTSIFAEKPGTGNCIANDDENIRVLYVTNPPFNFDLGNYWVRLEWGGNVGDSADFVQFRVG